MRRHALPLLTLLLLVHGANGQGMCYIDPFTGQQICGTPSSQRWQSAPGTRMVYDVPSPQSQVAQEQVNPMPSRCRVYAADGGIGSGTLIHVTQSGGAILTANHVVRGVQRASVTFPDGSRYEGTVAERDDFYDLALIVIPRPNIEPAKIDFNDPQGTLVAGGFGGDGSFRVVRGPITGYVVYSPKPDVLPMPKIAGAVRPGDSGGGVVNEAKVVVGVCWGAGGGETYVTCGQPVRNLIRRVIGDPPQYPTYARPTDPPAYVPPPSTPPSLNPPSLNPPVVSPPVATRPPVMNPPSADLQPPPIERPQPQQPITNIDQELQQIRDQLANIKQCNCDHTQRDQDINSALAAVVNLDKRVTTIETKPVDFAAIAAEMQKRLTHELELTRLDGTVRSQKKPLNEPIRLRLSDEVIRSAAATQ